MSFFFPDKNSNEKIPAGFIDFCKSVAEGSTCPDDRISVDVTVHVGEKIIRDEELLQGLKRKIEKDLTKNKRLKDILHGHNYQDIEIED